MAWNITTEKGKKRQERIERDGGMMVLMEPYSIGITGHRRLLLPQKVVHSITLDKIKELAEQHKGEEIEVISGMALGFDQLVCRVCLELGVPYLAAIPCEGQEALWNDKQKEEYKSLLSTAKEQVVVTSGPYEPWKMHARNAWIVNRSREMVVHWDGAYQGGTGNCMKLVKAKKLHFHNTARGG